VAHIVTTGRPITPPTEASLLEILQERVASVPDRHIFTFLEDGEVESERFTYHQLDGRARAIAAQLQEGVAPGDRVMLVYPPGLEFIAALFGCFYAGAIAVPVYPPRFGMVADPCRALATIARDCEPAAILVGGALTEPMTAACTALAELSSIRLIPTEPNGWHAVSFQPQTVGRDTIALLQYTSGSTGDPKGVVITHGNILENEHVIQLAFHHRTASRMGEGVCWLPFYHDMGLIGNVLQAVYVDGPCYLMSPLVLLQRPIRWLEAMTRYRAHSSGGPNFAYDLCVRRITAEQKATLDLSHWELAAIGAEPVSSEAMDRFAEAFAPCGFRREAFYPCYGLAEATLFVSGGDKEAPPVVRSFPARDVEYHPVAQETQGLLSLGFREDERAQTLVGCGHAWTDHEIVIADPVTLRECPAGVVGEIWFRGPSVAQGYWRRGHETAEIFDAALSDSGRGPFLRTGDLGFLSDGELFVSGRLKDLIVIRGHNHYPQDIEETVARLHEAFRPNTTAAMGCPIAGEERLVILQEIDRSSRRLDAEILKRDIVRAVAERHQLQVYEVLFVRNGTLPKTTSGKVRRHECRQRYLTGQLTLWTGTPSA
jgi:acyl-CoA synthetase (AMP-forming)/AMP-acid ligase II